MALLLGVCDIVVGYEVRRWGWRTIHRACISSSSLNRTHYHYSLEWYNWSTCVCLCHYWHFGHLFNGFWLKCSWKPSDSTRLSLPFSNRSPGYSKLLCRWSSTGLSFCIRGRAIRDHFMCATAWSQVHVFKLLLGACDTDTLDIWPWFLPWYDYCGCISSVACTTSVTPSRNCSTVFIFLCICLYIAFCSCLWLVGISQTILANQSINQ